MAVEPAPLRALIRIDPAVASKWGVSPAVPVVGGPAGIYTACDVTPVVHYGHGYGVAVAQGKVEGGLATNWNSTGFGWTGFGAPGDSGSPVLTADGRAAGDFHAADRRHGRLPRLDAGRHPDHPGAVAVRRLARERGRLAHGRGGRRLLNQTLPPGAQAQRLRAGWVGRIQRIAR